MYFARATPGGDDAANNQTTPCSNKPCQNGALCVIVANRTYNCLCSAGWAGKKYYIYKNKSYNFKVLKEKIVLKK